MTREDKLERLIARGNAMQLADYVINNKIPVKSLIDTYIAGPNRLTHRLAPAITEIAISHAWMMPPYWKSLIKAMGSPQASTALKRNTLRLMQFAALPVRQHGKVIDLCFRFLCDKSETIAVKVFAMSVAELLSREIEELRRELAIVIEDQLPYAGPAFRSRGAKVLKALRPVGIQ